MNDIICQDCGEYAKAHGSFGRYILRWSEVLVHGSNGIYPIPETEIICSNTEVGLLRDALRQYQKKEEIKDSDLKLVAKMVYALVPFKEKVRPTNDLNNDQYRFKWEDLRELSRIAHDN